MAKGLRASRTKKNNQALSKRVFGPVEAARNERLSAKLLALAQQPKAPREEMEIEKGMLPRHKVLQTVAVADQSSIDTAEKESGATAEDPDVMQDDDADGAPLTRTTTTDRSITKQKADRAQKKAKIQKRKAAPKPSNAMRFGAGTKKKTRKGGK